MPSSESESDESSSPAEPQPSQSSSTLNTAIKKLVRLALSTEYSRTPLRRLDISQKILAETSHSRSFKQVFAGAQKVLRETFGMQLVELPSREKTSLKDRRTQAAATQRLESQQAGSSSSSGSKSWILISILPETYKTHPLIATPSLAPSAAAESSYTALYTFIVTLIYLNAGALSEGRLERYLKRVNLETYTPLEISTDKLMARMLREGYVERRRDHSSGEEVIEWVVGPRGKVEVGEKGVVGLVKTVYGFGRGDQAGGRTNGRDRDPEDQEEEDRGDPAAVAVTKGNEEELDAKLRRSLGIANLDFQDPGGGISADRRENADSGHDGERDTQQQRRRVGRPRRAAMNNDDDDDDDD